MRTKEKNPLDSKPEIDLTDPHADLQKLIDAHEIMSDATKMEKVHALAGRHTKALKGLSKIKKIVEPVAEEPKLESVSDYNKILNHKYGSSGLRKLHKSASKPDKE
jgi:hypothetical protein